MGEWTPREKKPVAELYRRFAEGIEPFLVSDVSMIVSNAKPLDLKCRSPLPPELRLYVFNCTDHPAERRAGDYRIQMRLAGQKKKERGHLEAMPGSMLILAGYVSEFDVFVLWDALLHREFPYSKGVQVAGSTVHQAAINGMAEQRRRVRGQNSEERLVAVRADRLVDGINFRERVSREKLMDDHDDDTLPFGTV
ncbi:hypothetical protein [Amycolatopsis sp. cmx-4-68]|uniref:hypothetical protein n=1 Tax=Amycolatopsis sp. cmx-4-68 TaxID=2790938 RepID=UPI00397BEB16